MPLVAGQTLSFYEILGPLGAGGMGEVYRARDTRLEREVAIKVLPEEMAGDEERLRRFEREAKTLASLHHPNVASIFGIDQVGDTCFIAMELVAGEDLRQRLERGPLPVAEAVDVCRQIAEGLEAAHGVGVVHRDLKPANVRLTPDGVAKVLDFGLAKAAAPDGVSGAIGPDADATTTARPDSFLITEEGLVLGTPTYMSPEQARAKPVDRRTDIWAFGCVLYECLTGKRAFGGESLTDTLAAIVEREPDWSALPARTPPHVRGLLERCLDKNPRTRLRDIGEARIALSESSRAPVAAMAPSVPVAAAETPAGTSRPWIAWIAFALLGLVAGAALSRAFLGGSRPEPPLATHFDLVLDPPYLPEEIALSPDGRLLVHAARIDGNYHLFARRLDGHVSERIPGTEGGQVPFFSPDGAQIAFFSAGQLKRVRLDGGVPDVIVAVPGRLTSAFWAPDGTIVYGTSATGVLMRVEARAGAEQAPVPVNGLEPGIGLHTARPLPGWRSVLATMEDDTEMGKRIVVLDLETGDWKPVTRGEDARFVPPDRLMYVQQGRVMVTGFDPERGTTTGDGRMVDLVDPALVMMEGIDRFHAATSSGILIYPSGTISSVSRIVRVSEDGETTPTGLTGVAPQVDSTGRRAVACPRDNSVHVLDLVDRTDTPLTFLDTSWYPMWSQDDARIIFADRRRVAFESWTVAPDGSGEPELLFDDAIPNMLTTSVIADGTTMGYVIDPVSNRDIWIRRPGEGFEMILRTPANERVPIQSPDGRLFAYVSDEDGPDQIFLRDLAALERRWPVTTEGGISPVWSRDGERLYFIRGESILAVDVRVGGGIRIGPESLVLTQPGLDRDSWGNQTFDAMPDGELLISVQEPSDVTLRVVLDWRP